MEKYKRIEAKEPLTTLDRNLIDIQNTIIYYGEKILEEIKEIKNQKIDKKEINENANNSNDQITTHLKKIIAIQNGQLRL